jgi:hypothetical protein
VHFARNLVQKLVNRPEIEADRRQQNVIVERFAEVGLNHFSPATSRIEFPSSGALPRALEVQ